MRTSTLADMAAAATIALLMSAPDAMAAPVVEQAPVGPNVGFTWISQQASDTVRVLDEFQLAQTTEIGRVSWRGVYLGPNGTNQAPNSKQWVVSFWTDSSGQQPASYTATIDAAAVKTTGVAGGGWFGATPVDVYDFDVVLPGGFTADGGATYWLSLMSKTDDPATAFGWTMAVGDWQANTSVQQYTDANGNFVGSWAKEGDRAFALHAATVPEPGSFALMALALAGAAGGTLRRRSNNT